MQTPSSTEYDNRLTTNDDEAGGSQAAGACCLAADVGTKTENEWMQLESNSTCPVADDDKNSTDSLSSSLSMSDSDLSSDDGDSFDLSESESITDVTPLNSPYCDSPLPHSSSLEQKAKDSPVGNHTTGTDLSAGNPQGSSGEMNLIISAIKKLEFEEDVKVKSEKLVSNKGKSAPCVVGSDTRRAEQENQRLFKRIIQQHNRGKYCYSQNHFGHKLSAGNRYRHHRSCERDNVVVTKKSQSSAQDKDSSRRRSSQQKCSPHTTYQTSSGVSSSKTKANGTLCCSKSKRVAEKNAAAEVQGEINMH